MSDADKLSSNYSNEKGESASDRDQSAENSRADVQDNLDDYYEEESSEEEEVNPKIMKLFNSTNKGFIDNVRSAPNFIQPSEASAFFKEVFRHFDDSDLQQSMGNEILTTTRKLLRNPQILDVFGRKNLILLLPFHIPAYTDQVFAVVHDVLELNPNLFTSAFRGKFLALIRNDTKKGLSIITKFAQKFINEEEIDDPWVMLDILVLDPKTFLVESIIDNYVSLVLYLNENDDEYRNARFMNFWHLFMKFIDSVSKKCRARIYTTLCIMLEMPMEATLKLQIPVEQLKDDVKIPITQEPAFSLIYTVAKTCYIEKLHDKELVDSLLLVAEDNIKAAVILMTLAENEEMARLILGNGEWFLNRLPEASDTLRLFLIIFTHQNLRPEIVELESFITFLNYVLDELGSAGVVTIVCTIIRRILLTPELIKKMSSEKFIKNFLKTALENEDENKVALHSLLLFVNTLAHVGCCKDFINIIPQVERLLKDRNLSEIASYVAVNLTEDEKCAKKMINLKFDSFFKEHLNDQKSAIIRHNARRFLAKISTYNI